MQAARAWFRASDVVAYGPFFTVSTMLMHPDRGGVDHLQIAVIRLRYGIEDAIPHADFRPTPKSIGARRRGAVSLWDVCPGRPCPQSPVDPIQHLAIVSTRNAPWLIRQQRLD